ESRHVRVYGFAELSQGSRSNLTTSFDPASGAIMAIDRDHPDWVRTIGFDRHPTAYESSKQRSLAYEPYEKRPLSNHLEDRDDVMAVEQLDLDIAADGQEKLCWVLSFSDKGIDVARASLERWRDWEKGLAKLVEAYAQALSVSHIMVPEKVITHGVLWAKANMLRVMGRYQTGAGFTNDPGAASNVVARDVAWFVYGCDYLRPDYAADLLRLAARFQEPRGKIVEYWDARTGQSYDYGLNVNDDTPLFILAAGHHYLVTLDRQFLQDIYPAVARAARYLLSQKDYRGLIFCSARGTDVYGICGWRNVIPDVGISGAVTEVNSEVYASLRMAAEMARALGHNGDVGEFLDEAVGLADAINRHLLNPGNGLYYLNIDPDGNAIADVTCDEIFPVMFGVSPPEVAFRIISRLSRPDFWTLAGLRTASRNSPEYTPDRELGLRGGVWPGVSFWYAFAAARYHPESMVRALASFQHYNEDPIRYNTVPGQFSEWFDGESLANRGMRLSPWEPPRLLWAAVEGMLGVVHSIDGCLVQPLVPGHWKWVAVRHLPHAQREETMFLARQGGKLHIYGNAHGLSSDLPFTRYEQDVSDGTRCLHPDASVVALMRKDDLLVCLGNSADRTITVPLSLEGVLSRDRSYYL
ncbi:MAG TPA: hypothetical protein VHS06_12575, partial [Chloroflexota bacterium]|nr:hypothetical protein [Chloroflexota bacterium]